MAPPANPPTAPAPIAAALAPPSAAVLGYPDASGPLEGEDRHPGKRPPGFVSARSDQPDDLKRISGVGAQNESRLHGLGVWHFAQVAAWTHDNVLWVGSYLAFPGRIDREEWVTQAKILASGGATDFAARYDRGEVHNHDHHGHADHQY